MGGMGVGEAVGRGVLGGEMVEVGVNEAGGVAGLQAERRLMITTEYKMQYFFMV